MRRIALCLFALCLTLPALGCQKEEAPPATPPADTTPAADPAAPAE